MGYRDELSALRSRLAAAEQERDEARDEARRLRGALEGRAVGVVKRRPDARWQSVPGGAPTALRVSNRSDQKVEVFWLSYDGRERSAGTLVPGGFIMTQTYFGHCWRFVDPSTGAVLSHARVEPGSEVPEVVFGGVEAAAEELSPESDERM